jgi:hypothetical protein
MSRRRRFKQESEPACCSCNHVTDTPEWHGKKGSGAGLRTNRGAGHGNPFTRRDGCIHSELQHTTRSVAKKLTVKRLRLQ